ncbi:cation-translocating P-type ATPase [Mesoplasma syrphidae]|uniref:Cation-translocating P-type ATPase n=1 Tax=Mesoplasma syrphidae TaxID=225999 RepID=A0A2K9C293_9MOLU|nr:cation-translocating P-type ATPase [Mesoplasma syrphidae]AUF83599.1 cation-translocating P-type ATPase [Mesoplasma syrphidae]
MENYESKKLADIEKDLQTDFKKGLTQEQVDKKLLSDGKNELPVARVTPWYRTFLLAFIEPLQIILIIAAIISVVAPIVANKTGHMSFHDFIDFIVIIAIVIIDAILETVQTVKARKSVDALKALSKPRSVVIRDGQQKEIDAADLVVGDIVVLEAGKYVPAELRIIKASDFMIDESILTGESVPVDKHANKISPTVILAEKKNIAFMSTFTTAGRGIGVVIATAINSEIGKIAAAVNSNEDEHTPLEKKLTSFSYWISCAAAFVGVTIFAAMLFTGDRNAWANYLMVAITLAIGVIPESLAAVVSITLSFSTKRMAKENVIVKKLASVETLGSVNVICTDKTGTLTQNKMTVQKVIVNNKIITQKDYVKLPSSLQKELFLKSLVLPNDSVTEGTERIGDPTELALVDYAELMGIDEQKSRELWLRTDEIPFDSERKLMTTVNEIDSKQVTFTKGAIDQLLKVCSRIILNDQIINLTDEHRHEILKSATTLSDDALRVLAFAYSDDINQTKANYEANLIFVGAVAMIDPVRIEAVQAIEEAHAAGIRVVMITGDHAITALAIARDLDLAYTPYEVMSSEALERYSEEELLRVIDNIKVFARVNPDHKVRIVNALQKKGNIVSMTGDGVNDAPSLSKADIGVAMGITGTDVAKQAADVILTDDNFATIMKGVNEGRNVYQKIKRAIVLLMGFNLANVVSIFVISMILHVSPLEATNILFINLIVESCLAIAIGMGPLDDTLMLLPPKFGKNGLLKGSLLPIVKIGLFSGAASILAFFVGMEAVDIKVWGAIDESSWYTFFKTTSNLTLTDKIQFISFGRTAMFITTVSSPLLFAHLIKLSNWQANRKVNWTISMPLVYASLIALGLGMIVTFIPGINDNIFGLVHYGTKEIDGRMLQGWNAQNIWLIFASFGMALIAPLGILLTDAIVFYSYHLAPKSWQTNRELVLKMLEADRKEEIAQAKKNKQIKK